MRNDGAANDGINVFSLILVPFLMANGICFIGVATAVYLNGPILPYAVLSVLVYVAGVFVNLIKLHITHPEIWESDEDFPDDEDTEELDDKSGIVIEEVVL